MRCLSIQQPWAWLIVNRYKSVENRSWDTPVRGPIAIHAGKQVDREGYEWVRNVYPAIPLPPIAQLLTGGIVGTATVTGVETRSNDPWFFGPFGFRLADAAPCEFVPLRGHLGFFVIDDALVRRPTPEGDPHG